MSHMPGARGVAVAHMTAGCAIAQPCRRHRGAGRVRRVAFALALLVLAACGKHENPNDLPYMHRAGDSDPCVRAWVAAIDQADPGSPNFGTEPVPVRAPGEPPAERTTNVDMWIGPTRLVVPAKVAAVNGSYPQNHPKRFDGLRGTQPNVHPCSVRAGQAGARQRSMSQQGVTRGASVRTAKGWFA